MKGFGDLYKQKKKKTQKTKSSTEQIIKQAIQFHSEGNISEATKYYQKLISQRCNDHRVFSNYGAILQSQDKLAEAEVYYRKAIGLNPNFADAHSNLGVILKDLGKFEEAEVSYREAIKLHPDFANAHFNLGNILRDLGKLEEAEVSYRKAIELNPNLAKAYYSLSSIKFFDENKIWQDQLFSESILNKKSKKDQINIYFARSNILHKEKNYEDSSKFLKLANQLKLILHPSNSYSLIKQSKALINESIQQEINQKENT